MTISPNRDIVEQLREYVIAGTDEHIRDSCPITGIEEIQPGRCWLVTQGTGGFTVITVRDNAFHALTGQEMGWGAGGVDTYTESLASATLLDRMFNAVLQSQNADNPG